MRPQKVPDIDILTGLTQVFRSKGYEGATLADLAEATGLQKASLYHRFPAGKEEMAIAVLNHLDKWVEENVFKALKDESNLPEVRLKNGIDQIRTLYGRGKEVCIFRALSMEAGLELFEEQIKNGMKEWISTFEKIGVASQMSPTDSQKNALATLIQIQGSLIVARGLNDISIFENTLKSIENRYIGK
ncbi:MAG: TetR/AcrR family transcriptional regulator [Bacteroidota bacterium]